MISVVCMHSLQNAITLEVKCLKESLNHKHHQHKYATILTYFFVKYMVQCCLASVQIGQNENLTLSRFMLKKKVYIANLKLQHLSCDINH